MTVTERRRRMPRAERERQMMAVAEEIFAERGYAAASMDEIADRCGVSKPMIYEYFGSKDGLLVACIRTVRAEMAENATRAVEGATDAEDALRRGLTAFFRFADSRRRSWAMMVRNEVAMAGTGAAEEIEAIRHEQVELDVALFAAFLPHKSRAELEMMAQIVVGACERLSIWYVGQDEVGPEQAADQLLSLLWRGVADQIAVP